MGKTWVRALWQPGTVPRPPVLRAQTPQAGGRKPLGRGFSILYITVNTIYFKLPAPLVLLLSMLPVRENSVLLLALLSLFSPELAA